MKCCICQDNKESVAFGVFEGHQHRRCRRCDLVYLENLPEGLEHFIDDSKKQDKVEYWSFPHLYQKHQTVFDSFFEQRYQRMLKSNLSKGPILDVGVGYGFWAQYLKNNGLEVEGIDFSQEVVDYCRNQLQLNAKCESFEDYQTDKKFSAICMFDVLEHFERPELMLEKAYELLEEGGLIYIQVPNVLGLKIPYKHGLGLPYHLWQFNPKSLKLLLERGHLFKMSEYWTGIQGVIGVYEKGGPSFMTGLKWKLANTLKIGNRVQMIGRKVSKSKK